MARKMVVVSDFTGDAINEDEHASVTVLDHPMLRHPVRLDTSVTEIKSLEGTESEFAVIEVHRPNEAPERLVISVEKFDGLFKGDVGQALDGAESAAQEPEAPRRGRPKGSGTSAPAKPKRPAEQLQQIRLWARSNGYPDLSDRGRIPAEVEAAFEAAHKA